MIRDENIYAAYKGEKYIMDGTLDELSVGLGTSRRNLQNIISYIKNNHTLPRKDSLNIVLVKKVTQQSKEIKLRLSATIYNRIRDYAVNHGLTIPGAVRDICHKATK